MIKFNRNGEDCYQLSHVQRARLAENIKRTAAQFQIQLPSLALQVGASISRFLSVVNNRSQTVPVNLLEETAYYFGLKLNDLFRKNLPALHPGKETIVNIGELLHMWRRRLGLKQYEVANEFGITPKEVSLMERGVPLDSSLMNRLIRYLAPTESVGERTVKNWKNGLVLQGSKPYGLKEIKNNSFHALANANK